MNKPCARITLDLQQASTPTFVAVKKSDIGREIRITLSDGGFPYEISADCYAVLTGTKPDGNILYNHCDIEGNTIVYEITEQTTAAAGRMKAEVKLYGADDILVTSATFRIIIDGTVYTDDKVESSSEFSALTQLMSQVLEIIKNNSGESGGGISITIVKELPTEDISTRTLYLVKDTDAQSNIYTEYLYVNGSWEIIGSQSLDLSDYVKTVNGTGPDGNGNVEVVGISEIQKSIGTGKTSVTVYLTDGSSFTIEVSDGEDGTNGTDGSAVYLWDSSVEPLGEGRYASSSVTRPYGVNLKNGDMVISQDGGVYLVTNYYLAGFEPVFQFSIVGTDGAPGKSAYEYAKEGGYTGTEEEFAEKLASDCSGGNVDQASVEPAEDDIPKFFYGGALPQTKDDTVMPFRYISKTQDISGYCETKAQGASSISYAKKNQTTKFYKDADCSEKMKFDFKGWGEQRKFCFKANWIDLTHARNVVSARLWADIVKSRANYEELPELLRTSPNQGAIDGFPVKVYAAGVYQGRYTLNIPKDGWMANMDDENEAHCILCGENYGSGCFRAAANINGSDWSDELHETVPASIKTRWNEVISFVMNSTDEDFQANLGNYFDIPSLIDYHLFGLASCGLDAYGKNQLYMTYDGQRWIASMYDMDSTWGLYWNGSKFVSTSYGRNEYEDMISGRQGNLLYIRLEQLFWSELQSRWAELKNGVLSIENIINRFERFTDITPAELVKEDYASTTGGGKFTGIPSQTTNNIQQIRAFALARQVWTDEYVAGLTPEVEVPCTGITLSASELTFTAEGSQTLTATVTPDGCTDPVTWESDNTSVATVSGGVVTAIANGSATITAKCGEYSASCAVSVSGVTEAVPCTGVTLDKSELTFDGEGTQTITVTVTPSDTTDSVVWVSSDPAVAAIMVDGNVCTVQSVSNGNATITVTCGKYSASCDISVSGVAARLLYSLPEETEFDGVDDYIDTGIQLFDTPKDFTLLIRGDFSQTSNTPACIFHCMYEISPWPGLQLINTAGNDVNISGFSTFHKAQATGLAVVVRQGVISNIRILSLNGITEITPEGVEYVSFAKNLLLGCYQNNSNLKGRYWKGTIYEFKVWDSVLTNEDIDEKLFLLSNDVLYSNYSPAGASFCNTVTVDFNAGSYIEAQIDITGCTAISENVISIGKDVREYYGDCIHLYYTKTTGVLGIDATSSSSNRHSRYEMQIESGVMTLRIDKNGLSINNTIISADNFNITEIYENLLPNMLAAKVIAIGSMEGSTRSNATYNYIRVGVDT